MEGDPLNISSNRFGFEILTPALELPKNATH